jgi:2-keto-4-pentenoate hydratase
MTDIDVDKLADLLLAAYTDGPVPPLTESHPDLTVDDAYRVQLRQAELRIRAGATVAGFKVGLTSAAMRQQLGVHEPDYGHLFTDMVHGADTPIPVGGFLQPRAEPEIALVLGRSLTGPLVRVTDLLSATAYALPAIEIIDSRIADWRIGLADTVADNASSAGLVLGGTPTPVGGLDLSLLGCVFRQNGRILATGAGAAVLGSPLQAACWLANTLLARGAELAAGHVILTGSITAATPVRAGDSVTATIDRLGSVTALFD